MSKRGKTQTSFREVGSVSVAEISANHQQSMEILKKNNLRPLTYQDAFVNIINNPDLKEQLKGKWFYLAGAIADKSGLYIIGDKGELTKGKTDPEKTSYVYSGKNPLSLIVHTDNNAANNGRRFNLNASNRSDNAASMVPACIAGFNGNIMETYNNLYANLCTYENLELAWRQARKRSRP